MTEISVTGGARIGLVNATWPFANLQASESMIRLKTIVGTYDFQPSELVSLQRYGGIPFFASGIRFLHARADYPSKIIFWYLGNPEKLMERIRSTGFLPIAPASAQIKWRGFPVRWTAIVILILAWNGLLLAGRAASAKPGTQAELSTLMTLVPTLFLCYAIKRSSKIQNFILSDGHTIDEIKAYLSLFQTVAGVLLFIFTILVLAHAFD